ncbi:MAG: hypothetical protein M3137_07015, partial [Actinomycetota bacterium]|nr:hypothetical protein [Actinomycetota bacterium]
LGYLFWHRPGTVERTVYEANLRGFHDALATDPPAGLITSWTWRLAAPPWFNGPDPTYLDVYMTADLSTLAELECGAVTGSRRSAHDRAADAMAAGAGALMAVVAGDGISAVTDRTLAFVDKAPGMERDRFVAGLARGGGSVWMRRLVLGPGPEYLVTGADQLPTSTVWSVTPSAVITA